MSTTSIRPATLRELRESGWVSKSVKQEIHDNFLRLLADGEDLFPGIIGYDDTVIPEISIGLIAQHDMLFLGEKGSGQESSDAAVDPLPGRRDSVPRGTRHARSMKTLTGPLRRPAGAWSRNCRKRRSPSPGGGARDAMPNDSRRAPSSPI